MRSLSAAELPERSLTVRRTVLRLAEKGLPPRLKTADFTGERKAESSCIAEPAASFTTARSRTVSAPRWKFPDAVPHLPSETAVFSTREKGRESFSEMGEAENSPNVKPPETLPDLSILKVSQLLYLSKNVVFQICFPQKNKTVEETEKKHIQNCFAHA